MRIRGRNVIFVIEGCRNYDWHGSIRTYLALRNSTNESTKRFQSEGEGEVCVPAQKIPFWT